MVSKGMEFPNLPYVIDGDFMLSESKAVNVYICDRWAPALMGSTPIERASIIMIQNVLNDKWCTIVPAIFGTGDKNDLIEKLTSALPPLVEYLGSKPFLHGDSVRLTDFILFEIFESANAVVEDDRHRTAHPTLAAHHARMLTLPTFSAYFNSDKALKAPFFPQRGKILM